MSIYRCRLCGSTNIDFNPEKGKRSRSKPKSRLFEINDVDERYSLTRDEPYHCRDCGHDSYKPMDKSTREKIDRLLLDPVKNKRQIERMRKVYPNIEEIEERVDKKSKKEMKVEKDPTKGKKRFDFLIGDGIERLELLIIGMLDKYDMLSILEMETKLDEEVLDLQERYVLKAILNLVDLDIIKKRVDIHEEKFSLIDKSRVNEYIAVVEKELKENSVAVNVDDDENKTTYVEENTTKLQSMLGGIFKNNDTTVIQNASKKAQEDLYSNPADKNNNGIDDSYEKGVYMKINELKREKLKYHKILLEKTGKGESKERAVAEEKIKEIDRKIIELIDKLDSLK